MSVRRIAVVAVALLLVVAGACRKPAKTILTKDQRSRIEENVLKQVPTPKIGIGAEFSDNLKLIGIDLSNDKVKPGDPVSITYYWECVKEIPGDWKVFGHLELPGGKRMILDHGPVGELYPIGQWKKGEIIRDVQKITIDSDAKAGPATLWMGIFNEEIYRERGGGDRMVLANKDKVANDGDNRVKVTGLSIDGPAAPKAAATLKAYRATGAVTVDGKAAETDWAIADATKAFTTADGRPADAAAATTVKAMYDDKNLYFFFHVLDSSIESPFKNRDDELWTQDVVEIYLDPNADGTDYVELQISPAGVVFDALFKTHRTPDWKEAKNWSLAGLQQAVVLNGTLNQAGDQDVGYDVEVAVPFASIPGFKVVPPEVGSSMRVNFFRMDAKDGKVTGAQAFAPAGGDFHDLNKAGTLEFAGTKPAAVPAPAAPAAAASPEKAPAGAIAPATGAPRMNFDPAILKGGSIRARPIQAAPLQPSVERK